MANQQVGALSNLYLQRYAYPEQLISTPPPDNLDLVVTIPCFKEEALARSLKSLLACVMPTGFVEVIVVINNAIDADDSIKTCNYNTYKVAKHWAKKHTNEDIAFHIHYKAHLPNKHAGVGLARKIAMDEAVRRFEMINKPDGIIICFDADSICEQNYLIEIENFFHNKPKCPGASIYYEHPVEGNGNHEIYAAITEYELHLRYYVHALRYANYPYAYQTIGSGMAVRANSYQKQGGMNRRKAGEDFYFIHKIIPLGYFGEINTTTVIPSPRPSDRVPFGTGKAVNTWLENKCFNTYDPTIFRLIKLFITQTEALLTDEISTVLSSLPIELQQSLAHLNAGKSILKCKQNSTSLAIFKKHFFHWFDGLKVLKLIHFLRDNYFANVPVGKAATELLQWFDALPENTDNKNLLKAYRKLDKISSYRADTDRL